MASDVPIALGTPAYRRLTLAMLFAGFSTFSLLYSVQPLLPLFAADYHLSAEAASLAVSLATGPLAIGILFAGILSDRVGRRPLMVVAMFAAGALTLAAALVQACPRGGPGSTAVNNNAVTDPNVLSNQYYKNLATGEVMFTSDQTLTSSAATAKMVQDNAANPVAWMARFAGAMVKMGGIEVLTGTQGEIRNFCGATNSGS